MNAGCAETPGAKAGSKNYGWELEHAFVSRTPHEMLPGPEAKDALPPKNMLKRSSGLSSPSNVAPVNGLVAYPDEGPADDIPPNLDSGSPPLRSYIARFCGSVLKDVHKTLREDT
jgi:hypothetical protein